MYNDTLYDRVEMQISCLMTLIERKRDREKHFGGFLVLLAVVKMSCFFYRHHAFQLILAQDMLE
jgi:hypothetical protein